MARFLVVSNEVKGMRPVGQKSQPNWKKIFSQLEKFFFPVREAKIDIYKRDALWLTSLRFFMLGISVLLPKNS